MSYEIKRESELDELMCKLYLNKSGSDFVREYWADMAKRYSLLNLARVEPFYKIVGKNTPQKELHDLLSEEPT